MESQYYTPTIEEFHVGFEFEMDAGTGWSKQTFPKPWWESGGMGGINTLKRCIEDKSIRVKHLDRQDIEECGWEMEKILVLDDDENDTYSDGFVKRIGNDVWFELVELGKFNFYIQKKWYRNSVTQMCRSVFYGNIRNKSELKKLMQMLNIK